MTYTYGFYFSEPWWLIGLILLVPVIWLGLRNLAALGTARRVMAITIRCLVIIILIALLARPMLTRKSKRLLVEFTARGQPAPAFQFQKAVHLIR